MMTWALDSLTSNVVKYKHTWLDMDLVARVLTPLVLDIIFSTYIHKSKGQSVCVCVCVTAGTVLVD